MKEKLEAVAALLGGTLMPSYGENTWLIVIGDQSDWKSLKLLVYRAYGKPENVRCITYYCGNIFWKDGQLNQESHNYHEGNKLHINVNMTRPIESLVKDINKRLVIPAEKANLENVAAVVADMAYKAKVLAFGREFGHMEEADRKVRVYVSKDYRDTVELAYINDTHAVLRMDFPHDKVRKVVNFIKEMINEPTAS